MPSVSYVVPVYPFDEHALGMATRSLMMARAHTPDAEFVVVHNGGLAEGSVLESFADVYVHLDPNQGYSPAVNAGIRAASCDILAVSSHDVFVQPGWLPPALRALHEGVAIATPVIDDPKWRKYTGALFVMPRWVYEQVGPLDEDELRMRCGEQDFAIRAHLMGLRIELVTDSHFIHDRSGVRSIDLQEPGRVRAERDEMVRRYGADRYIYWLKAQGLWP